MGVNVDAGVLKTGTPLCVPSKGVSVFVCEFVRALPDTLLHIISRAICCTAAYCMLFVQFVEIGIVTSIEVNHKPVDTAKKGQEICVKIEPIPGESPKMYGRHFEAVDIIVSKVGLCTK